jgi:hypothetical protein
LGSAETSCSRHLTATCFHRLARFELLKLELKGAGNGPISCRRWRLQSRWQNCRHLRTCRRGPEVRRRLWRGLAEVEVYLINPGTPVPRLCILGWLGGWLGKGKENAVEIYIVNWAAATAVSWKRPPPKRTEQLFARLSAYFTWNRRGIAKTRF